METTIGHQMSIRMSRELDTRLGIIAKRVGLKKADLVRYALDQTLPKIETDGITLRPAALTEKEAA